MLGNNEDEGNSLGNLHENISVIKVKKIKQNKKKLYLFILEKKEDNNKKSRNISHKRSRAHSIGQHSSSTSYSSKIINFHQVLLGDSVPRKKKTKKREI